MTHVHHTTSTSHYGIPHTVVHPMEYILWPYASFSRLSPPLSALLSSPYSDTECTHSLTHLST
jgi:hypothetical protein